MNKGDEAVNKIDVLDKGKWTNLSYSDRAIMYAYELGYRSDENGKIYSHKENKLSLGKGTNGYLLFRIWKKDKHISISAHRFSAYCYFGNELFDNECVMHRNGIKTDNSKENLAIGSLRENYQDNCEKWKESFSLKGAKTKRKFTESQIREIKNGLRNGTSFSQLARSYGVAKSTIQQIKERKTYKWVKL